MKSIYFFISYPRTKKDKENSLTFTVPENNNDWPTCIYSQENYDYDNQIYYYKKIFKAKTNENKKTKENKKANNYYYEFEIDDDKYIISFDSKGRIFIYDVTLEMGKKIIDIRRKINQNNIEYKEKIDDFLEALKQNNEGDNIENLYKQTIDLYSEKKGFSFLIALFLKTYKKKDLCSSLLAKFKEMNKNPKDNEKNMDRKQYLKQYMSDFNTIKSNAEKLINNYEYNIIEFYGIILCYFNYYDLKTFSSIINELFIKKPNELYEILLIYNAHFKYQINQNLNFFNGFIEYAILNKEFPIFKIGLNYIRDIETFINVIEKNKEIFFNKYIKPNVSHKIEFIIELEQNLKFKNNDNIKENKTKNIENNKTEIIEKNKNEDIEKNSSFDIESDEEKSEGEINSKGKLMEINEKENIKVNNNVKQSIKQYKEENDFNIKKKEKISLFLKSLKI